MNKMVGFRVFQIDVGLQKGPRKKNKSEDIEFSFLWKYDGMGWDASHLLARICKRKTFDSGKQEKIATCVVDNYLHPQQKQTHANETRFCLLIAFSPKELTFNCTIVFMFPFCALWSRHSEHFWTYFPTKQEQLPRKRKEKHKSQNECNLTKTCY